jgi:uncharacterized protein YdaU (DUF1376 family)
MHYYNFNIGDYMKHTLHLTPEEDLAYRRLLDMYYDTEAPIPSNIPLVSRRLRMASEIVESVLNEFFDLTDEGYKNYRADGEIADYHKFLEKQKANGRLGGRPKKGKKPIGNPPITQAEPKKSLNNKQQTTNNKQYISPIGFDLFWDAYDKKVGKPNAQKEWLKANIDEVLLKTIVEQAKKYAQAVEKQFRKDPERWIKYRGWENEIIVNIASKASEMPLGSDKQIEEAYRVECGGDPTKARFNSYFEMRKFVLDQREKRSK